MLSPPRVSHDRQPAVGTGSSTSSFTPTLSFHSIIRASIRSSLPLTHVYTASMGPKASHGPSPFAAPLRHRITGAPVFTGPYIRLPPGVSRDFGHWAGGSSPTLRSRWGFDARYLAQGADAEKH